MSIADRVYEIKWFGRNLDNYKQMQAKVAESKGVLEALMSARTLTQARKIVYGHKKGNSR